MTPLSLILLLTLGLSRADGCHAVSQSRRVVHLCHRSVAPVNQQGLSSTSPCADRHLPQVSSACHARRFLHCDDRCAVRRSGCDEVTRLPSNRRPQRSDTSSGYNSRATESPVPSISACTRLTLATCLRSSPSKLPSNSLSPHHQHIPQYKLPPSALVAPRATPPFSPLAIGFAFAIVTSLWALSPSVAASSLIILCPSLADLPLPSTSFPLLSVNVALVSIERR